MLLASILRCFYWLGAGFETSLLVQSLLMIAVQLTLLKVALDHRPPPLPLLDLSFPTPPTTAVATTPAAATATTRPWGFWQWRRQRPYWEFLAYFTLGTAVLQLLFGQTPRFVDALGYLALGIEALLPLPQVLANQRSRSCRGFRPSVLASWLAGDAMKIVYFSNSQRVGVQFKACAAVQTAFDLYLGLQFWWFGSGSGPRVAGLGEKAVLH